MNSKFKKISFITTLFLICNILTFQLQTVFPCYAATPDLVVLGIKSKTLSIGDEYFIPSFTLSGKQPRFKSSKSSIVSVNTYGVITAKCAGTAKITAKVKGHEASCIITVKPTTIQLSKTHATLFRNQSFKLKVTTSTGHTPTFRSSKSSVATVDENGVITAMKNGIANIKVSCDKTTVICEIRVQKPTINLSKSTLNLKVGQSYQVKANVSSNNPVKWSVSNINIISVNDSGLVTARQKGKAYLYAYEDGTKVSCIIKVSNP